MNKEREKEEQYNNLIVDKITLNCCEAVFSRKEYMKSLIDNNIHSENPQVYYWNTPLIRCICGRILERSDLKRYFDSEQIDNIYVEIGIGRSKSNFGIKKLKPSDEEIKDDEEKIELGIYKSAIKTDSFIENSSECGSRVHGQSNEENKLDMNCYQRCSKSLTSGQISHHNKKLVLPCCNNESLHNQEGVKINDTTPVKACTLCSKKLHKDETGINFKCGHCYHVLCAKTILESNNHINSSFQMHKL